LSARKKKGVSRIVFQSITMPSRDPFCDGILRSDSQWPAVKTQISHVICRDGETDESGSPLSIHRTFVRLESKLEFAVRFLRLIQGFLIRLSTSKSKATNPYPYRSARSFPTCFFGHRISRPNRSSSLSTPRLRRTNENRNGKIPLRIESIQGRCRRDGRTRGAARFSNSRFTENYVFTFVIAPFPCFEKRCR
jgi:hypothetical protein